MSGNTGEMVYLLHLFLLDEQLDQKKKSGGWGIKYRSYYLKVELIFCFKMCLVRDFSFSLLHLQGNTYTHSYNNLHWGMETWQNLVLWRDHVHYKLKQGGCTVFMHFTMLITFHISKLSVTHLEGIGRIKIDQVFKISILGVSCFCLHLNCQSRSWLLLHAGLSRNSGSILRHKYSNCQIV